MKISNLKNINPKEVSDIILDWGGVITPVNFDATVKAFYKLGHTYFEKHFTQSHQSDLFKNFEKGLVTAEFVYSKMIKEIGKPVNNTLLFDAWCAMLLDTPDRNIDVLKKLGKKYNLFLLSNTNEIHTAYYENYLSKKINSPFKKLFLKTYYSYELKMRKPDREIFEFVIDDCSLIPSNTLFVDDNEINVISAESTGIIGLYLSDGLTLPEIFNEWI